MGLELYLMRHGEAKTAAEDPRRPLAAAGQAAVRDVASRAADQGIQIERIYHSGILRARQTAQILASRLHLEDVEKRAGLEPEDEVETVARWLFELGADPAAQPIALVGHLPFLEKLSARLISGDEAAGGLPFSAGTLAKLSATPGAASFSVSWMLHPEGGP